MERIVFALALVGAVTVVRVVLVAQRAPPPLPGLGSSPEPIALLPRGAIQRRRSSSVWTRVRGWAGKAWTYARWAAGTVLARWDKEIAR
jgi:hypothetical protein